MKVSEAVAPAQLRRTLGLWDLILYGIVVIQPTAPMPVYGVVSERAHGHVVTAVLIAMTAMLFTAISYGRMSRAYPSAGSAFTYVGKEIHPALGFLTGWGMVMDYLLNPLICVILCTRLAQNIVPQCPYAVAALFFAVLFTGVNLFGIQTSARISNVLATGMGVVITIFFLVAGHYIFGHFDGAAGFFTKPFYDPQNFRAGAVLGGTSLAVLTYIGFDGISTLAEEAKNPRRDVLLATVLVCLAIGTLSACEVYAAQLIWPVTKPFPSVETAFVSVAGMAGGRWMLHLVNATLLVATIGSGMGSQLGAARLLYAMGRSGAIPRGFFGQIERKRHIPRNNVLFSGALALAGALTLSFASGVDLLNFGALTAFMGVNGSSFARYFLRNRERRVWADAVPPLLGFAVCFVLWWNLNDRAKAAGLIWMALGLLYGAVRTRGFRGELVNFDFSETAGESESLAS